MPLVSVIINCYNGSRDLPACFDCLRRQTFTDFEIVFLDNCSEDDSAKIAQSFGPKLRYFKSPHNVPLGAARNLALQEAKGDLIAFLDCDDLWLEDKLARQVDLMQKDPDIGLVTCDTILSDGHKELGRVFTGSPPARGFAFAELVERQWISMSSAMVSRKALASLTSASGEWVSGWFDETLNVCEEADVFYRIAYNWKIDYVEEPLAVWRIHG